MTILRVRLDVLEVLECLFCSQEPVEHDPDRRQYILHGLVVLLISSARLAK